MGLLPTHQNLYFVVPSNIQLHGTSTKKLNPYKNPTTSAEHLDQQPWCGWDFCPKQQRSSDFVGIVY